MPYLQIELYSDTLKKAVRVNAVMPDNISNAPVPVLLLLHGMTDDESCWQRRTSIERYADETGIAVIMPDAELSWYCDTPMGEDYFTFITDELLAAMRRMLPALSRRREDTYAGGLSMGGYGALKCVLCCPETFSAAVCLSGAYDPNGLPVLVNPETVNGFDWTYAFGRLEGVPGSVNDLRDAAEKLKGALPRIYMWCGTDDSLLPMSRDMRDVLKAENYPMLYHETTGGHEWPLWDREINTAMHWLRGEEVSVCH